MELYEPGALTLVARAGTPLAEVEAVLAAEGQRLPSRCRTCAGLLGTERGFHHRRRGGGQCQRPAPGAGGAAAGCLMGVRFVDGQRHGHQERRAGDEERHRL
jgi:glycolate oxidase FAD binding subunit